jgi:hypothetical protein
MGDTMVHRPYRSRRSTTMKKQLIALGAITAIGTAGLIGVASASAESGTTTTNPMSSLVKALASKFSLKEADVQAVFDADRTAMQQQREADVKSEVAQLVKDGKLTQAQADAINAKRVELEKEREANRTSDQNLTEAERKTKMDEHKATLDQWMKDNGIDSTYAHLLMGGRGHGPGGPDGGPGARGAAGSTSTTTTSSSN